MAAIAFAVALPVIGVIALCIENGEPSNMEHPEDFDPEDWL
ncbi:MAG: hypothetical protein WA906_02935 [Pacificimonas sp.]